MLKKIFNFNFADKNKHKNNYEIIAQLPGFLDFEAYKLFYLLQEINLRYRNILEIGVFCGRSLAALASVFPTAKFIGVDPFYENFRKSPAYKDEANYLSNASNKQKPEERINNLWKIISLLDKRNRTELLKNISLAKTTQDEFFNTCKKTKFQLCHVDGEHTFRAIEKFLNILPSFFSRGSIIIIDDFLNPGFPDISEAVHTHPCYKKSLFPFVYAFNKAVFIYKPNTGRTIASIRRLLTLKYSETNYIVRRLYDGSLMIAKKE